MSTTGWQTQVVEALKANDVRLIAHVADSVLAPVIRLLEADPFFRVVGLTREEEGIGLVTGSYLGGTRAALLLQASGLGNTINALGSLAIPYQIPMPILLSPRGGLLEHNIVQIAGGAAAPAVLAALGIPVFDLTDPASVPFVAHEGIRHAWVARRPVVLSISTQLSGGKRGSR